MDAKKKFIKEWEKSYKLLEIDEDIDIINYRRQCAKSNFPPIAIRHSGYKMGIRQRKEKAA